MLVARCATGLVGRQVCGRQLRTGAAAAAAAASGANADTIGGFFVNLGADAAELGPEFAALKAAIAQQAGFPAAVRAAYAEAEAGLRQLAAEVQSGRVTGEDLVPRVPFAAIRDGAAFGPDDAARIRKAGVVIVEGVVGCDEALDMKSSVRQYIQANPGHRGFPEDDPQIFEVYWSNAQLAARQHPHVLATNTALNRLWHLGHPAAGSFCPGLPVTYVDRLRIRQPGDATFALGPHVDGGSLERWQDAEYRRVYTEILAGNWQGYDPYDATHRLGMTMDLYDAPNACSFFRTFQGWLSLSDCRPGTGALRVAPLLKEATTLFMLRPFLEDVPPTVFPGAFPGKGQDINAEAHSAICDAMVSVPSVRPGDAVFWHCDAVHAVESVHNGDADASVFFIPAAAMCATNARYLAAQREAFLSGRTPPDFPQNHDEVGFHGRATQRLLTEAGARALGAAPYPSLPGDCQEALAL